MRSLKGWALAPTGTDAGRTRPAARRRGRIAGAAITALLAVTMVPGLVAPASADVSANGVGPIAANGFPEWFSDGTTKLALCDTVAAGCIGDMATTNEGFYFSADASTPTNPQFYSVALEATNDPALGNLAFTRIRMRIGGLTVGANYTVTHPYGVNTFTAADRQGGVGGTPNSINFTSDLGCLAAPCAGAGFAAAGAGFAGNYAAGVRPTFLMQSNRVPGMIGDINVPGTVTGAPSGLNAVTLTGPNAGGPGINTLTTNQFAVQGLISTLANPAPRAPNAPIIKLATAGNASAVGSWTVPGRGYSPITLYHVRVVDAATGTKIFALRDTTATSLNITGLPNGIAARVQVQAKNAIGMGGLSNVSNAVIPATVASKPTIKLASAGVASATGNWVAPFNGGSVITRYHVRVVDAATGKRIFVLRDVAGTARSMTAGLPRGFAFRFQVQAINAKGVSGQSNPSNAVIPR